VPGVPARGLETGIFQNRAGRCGKMLVHINEVAVSRIMLQGHRVILWLQEN
jgi:hypothetical protein